MLYPTYVSVSSIIELIDDVVATIPSRPRVAVIKPSPFLKNSPLPIILPESNLVSGCSKMQHYKTFLTFIGKKMLTFQAALSYQSLISISASNF